MTKSGQAMDSKTTFKTFTVKDWGKVLGGSDSFSVSLPRFQRSIVWGQPKKRMLISSLVNGMPIGTLLVATEQEETRPTTEASLVDGLQRSSAIQEFIQSPQKMLDLREINGFAEPFNDLAQSLRAAGIDVESPVLLTTATLWLQTLSSLESAAGFSWDRLGRELMRSIGASDLPLGSDLDLHSDAVERSLRSIEDLIRKTCDRGLEAEIHVLVYWGPREFWPDIFERLNRAGTQLSRYEVFAAMWANKTVSNGDVGESLRKIVRERYKDVDTHGIHLAFDLDGEVPLTLFEYLFALGRSLATDYPNLFVLPSDAAEEVPAVFNLVNVLHHLRTADMERLPARMAPQPAAEYVRVRRIEEAIREACRDLQERIGPLVNIGTQGPRSGRRLPKPEVPFSSNQIVSILARLVLERYEIVEGEWVRKASGDSTDRYRDILSNAPRHLLHDVLWGAWAGHGDAKLHQVVWESTSVGGGLSGHYLNPITDAQLGVVLDAWHNEQLSKQHWRRVVGPVERLVLKHIHANGPHLDLEVNTSEIEHIYPVAGLVRRAREGAEGAWPINAISNLALLSKRTNRHKLDLSVADYLAARPKGTTQAAYAVMSEHVRIAVLLQNPESLSWTYGMADGAEFGKSGFLAFLSERWEAQKEEIFRTLQRLDISGGE